MIANDIAKCAGPRLLVADDDPLMVKLVSASLRDAGFEVQEAYGGATALEACISQKPHLAILDFEMPDLGGAELAVRIHSRVDVPVIFLTARDEVSVIEQAIGAGALAYLIKPVKTSLLLATVRTSLQRAREAGEMLTRTKNLSTVLATDRAVDMATGLLMGRLGMSEQDAFACLRQQARTERVGIEEVARQLISASGHVARLFTEVARHAARGRRS